MATPSDFANDARIALSGLNITPQISGFREEQRNVAPFAGSRFRMIDLEDVITGSNVSTVIVISETEIFQRSNGTLVNDRGTEETVAELCLLVANPDFWTAMPSVRVSPQPEITYSDEIERIGNVYRGTIRVEVSLEREP